MPTITDSFGRSADERMELRRHIEELTAEAKDNWEDPRWRYLAARAITESIYVGFQTENVVDLITTIERVGETDRIQIKEVRGLRAFWTAKGAWIEESALTEDIAELPRRTIGYHVYEFEDKLRNSFGETQANLITLGQARLDAEINLRVLRTFQYAIPAGSPYYIGAAGLSLTAIDAAINAVADETLDGQVVIVGRRSMTGQIVDALSTGGYTGFLPTTNEELLRRGVLGEYKGAQIVTLKNYRDDAWVSFFPANELYVVGRDASKFGYWGGPKTMEWTDHDWYWHYQARLDFGGGVFRPERLRRFVDTSLAP
jgi:hypothetical protein